MTLHYTIGFCRASFGLSQIAWLVDEFECEIDCPQIQPSSTLPICLILWINHWPTSSYLKIRWNQATLVYFFVLHWIQQKLRVHFNCAPESWVLLSALPCPAPRTVHSLHDHYHYFVARFCSVVLKCSLAYCPDLPRLKLSDYHINPGWPNFCREQRELRAYLPVFHYPINHYFFCQHQELVRN